MEIRNNGTTAVPLSMANTLFSDTRGPDQADLQRLTQVGLLEHSPNGLVPTILASRILDGEGHFACTPTDLLSKHSRERLLTECLVKAVTIGSFPLNQPRPEARYYFDLDTFISSPGWHRDVLLRLLEIILRQIQELVGTYALACRIPTSGLIGTYPLVFALSERFGLSFSVNWQGQKYWRGESSLGWRPSTSNNKCVILHDVLSSGISVADLVSELTETGAQVAAAVSIFDREEGALPYLASQKYQCMSLISFSELHALLATSPDLLQHLAQEKIDKFRDTFGQRTHLIDMGSDHVAEIDVCVMQIRSAIQAGGEYRFNPLQRAKQLETIRTRVDPLLKTGLARVFVFPELSVPYIALDYLAGIAKQHKSWIVAGMEYDHLKQNKCMIIPPIGEPVAQLKLTRSQYDDRQMMPGYQQWVYARTGFGNFAAVVCIDLMQSPLIADLRNRLDVIFVVSYNSATKLFVDKASSLAIELHCFVVLVNVANFGSSVVFAPMKGKRKLLLRMPRKRAGVGIVHLDIPQLRSPDNPMYYAPFGDDRRGENS